MTNSYDECTFKVEVLHLDRQPVHIRKLIDPVAARGQCRIKADDYIAYVKDRMVAELTSWLCGRVIDGITLTHPANWLEAWKENAYRRGYLGPWAKALWPVRYITTTLKAWEAFPSVIQNEWGQTVLMRHDGGPAR